LEKIEIKLYTLIHTKTHMNAYKKTNKMDEVELASRIAQVHEQADATEWMDRRLKYEDPLQYFKIPNKTEYVNKLIEQVRTGQSKGTCMSENFRLFAITLQRILTENNGKELATDAKFVRIRFYMRYEEKEDPSVHFFVLVKINNLWYVRDYSNNIQTQQELCSWLRDHHAYARGLYACSHLPFKKKGDGLLCNNDDENYRPLNLNLYTIHNRIVLNMRGLWGMKK
jgi:hypothetical protein